MDWNHISGDSQNGSLNYYGFNHNAHSDLKCDIVLSQIAAIPIRQKGLQNNCFYMLSMVYIAFIAISCEQSQMVTREEEATVLFCYLLFPAESSKKK